MQQSPRPSAPQTDPNPNISELATRLGYFGLIPFLGTILITLVGVNMHFAFTLFIGYSAVILSFLGGIHWGWIMQGALPAAHVRLKLAMLPSLLAWAALLVPSLWAVPLLGLAFIGWWAYENPLIREHWYRDVRKRLSFVVLACHLIWFLMLWRAATVAAT